MNTPQQTAESSIGIGHDLLAYVGKIALEVAENDRLIANIVNEVVPAFSDWCVAYFYENNQLKIVSAAHKTKSKDKQLSTALLHEPLASEIQYGIERVLDSKCVQVLDLKHVQQCSLFSKSEPSETSDESFVLDEFFAQSYLICPICLNQKVSGFFVFAREQNDSQDTVFSVCDVSFAASLGEHIAVAIENLHMYSESKRAARAREDVLAVVAHDVKNPVCSVLMASQIIEGMLTDKFDATHILRYLKIIQGAAQQANSLMTLLLDFGKMQSGKFVVLKKEERLDPLIKDILDLFLPVAKQKNIQFIVDCPPTLTHVLCERDRLLQVFSNLIGNAFKFTPAGGTVSVIVKSDADCSLLQTPSRIRFEICDTGVGIPADHLERVFDLYWQGKQAKQVGVGLGLSITKGIIEAHGGSIWVESELNHGCRFVFELPVGVATQIASVPRQTLNSAQRPRSNSGALALH